MRLRHLLWAAVLAGGGVAAQAAQLNGEIDKQFNDSVQKYVSLRERVAGQLPRIKKTGDPAELDERKKALAAAMREERSDAKLGDIFTPDVARRVKEICGQADGAAANATKEGNPKEEGVAVRVEVNAPYPTAAPLSTMPPSLLLQLPKLPEGLEYRFVDRTLILYDAVSGLIVDYIPNAI
ncbi:MAG: hypothetical protein KIT09_13730 [Bryobacteraceae bacterium]|nr:hypothetical protein [Bryobacteraceae bacterium]